MNTIKLQRRKTYACDEKISEGLLEEGFEKNNEGLKWVAKKGKTT